MSSYQQDDALMHFSRHVMEVLIAKFPGGWKMDLFNSAAT
jgi:hypothetical protein